MTLLVGISGPIGSGKSTLAHGLTEVLALLHMPSVVIPFATGLKYLGGLQDTANDINDAYHYFRTLGYDVAKASQGTHMLMEAFNMFPVEPGIKPRRLYQYIGTELGRDTIDKDIWIKDVKNRVRALERKPYFVFSDDMRFVNESHNVDIHIALKATTPLSVAVYNARRSLLPPEYLFDDHPSEKERDLLCTPDYTLEIAYTPKELVAFAHTLRLDSFMRQLGA